MLLRLHKDAIVCRSIYWDIPVSEPGGSPCCVLAVLCVSREGRVERISLLLSFLHMREYSV